MEVTVMRLAAIPRCAAISVANAASKASLTVVLELIAATSPGMVIVIETAWPQQDAKSQFGAHFLSLLGTNGAVHTISFVLLVFPVQNPSRTVSVAFEPLFKLYWVAQQHKRYCVHGTIS